MSGLHAALSRIATFFVSILLSVVVQAGPNPVGPGSVGPINAAPEPTAAGPSDFEIAFAHAPVHYQDTDDSRPKADYITLFNYDGDWRANNNWDHLNNFPLPAHVYYSVVETCTHWFIGYAFFHPQDWTDGTVDQEHENDMEGSLAVVRKFGPSGPRLGRLEAIVTTVHSDFYSYVPSGSPFQNGAEDIDGTLTLATFAGSWRPQTSQEAKGHPLKAWPYAGDFDGLDARDGIIYYPSKDTSEVPSSGNDRSVKYQLESFFAPGGLWARQLTEADLPTAQTVTFFQWGRFGGDKSDGCGKGRLTVVCATNSANPPWRWDDNDDGPVYPGEMALDPAHLVERYFSNLGAFSTKYLRNQYVSDLKARGYAGARAPSDWPQSFDLDGLYAKMVTRCG
jgi:hypothetical protein